MKKTAWTLSFSFFLTLTFGQISSNELLIYLVDGGFLRANSILEKEDDRLEIQLLAGSSITLPKDQVWKIKQSKNDYLLLSDGRWVKWRGGYSTLSVQTLFAQAPPPFEDEIRSALGVEITGGYQFNPWLMAGIGFGIDTHDKVLAPAFLEIRGTLVPSNTSVRSKSGHGSQWLWERSNTSAAKRRLLLTYGMQLGFNLPLGEIFSERNAESVRGGRLFYPWVGLQLPSRSGPIFQLDIGYKFQRYAVTSIWWGGYRETNEYQLRSFALKAGWVF